MPHARGASNVNDASLWLLTTSTSTLMASGPTMAPGYDANIEIFDPAIKRELSTNALHSALDYSVCEGMTCTGWARDVLLRGNVIVREGLVNCFFISRSLNLISIPPSV
jgi:dihydroorotase-like cyclic amidohydrolase